MFLRQITKDSMLYAVLAAPLLAAFFFRFVIPIVEIRLCAYFGKSAILSDYYLLFDLFLATLTPYMFCFASSMVVLTELDESMAGYLAVTPVGKRGYILSRLVFPAAASFFGSVVLVSIFSLTAWTVPILLITCLLTSILSIAVSLLILSFSHNRVEGMAMAKLSSVMMLGLLVPFFLFSEILYLFSPLPSLWIAKLCLDHHFWPAAPALLSSLLWIWILYGRFEKKLS
ncbi:hypothetical protein SDC9_148080 [bioreactor metagenome]|uniref:Fluoroquinolones export permease protein n=1 Tax=bioreactor metagenome TaxID=1076179 RepID=A0A645EHY8_9ZZZZ